MDKEVIETNSLKNGQDKCPKCGATDITLNVATGKLRCNFCRFEFDPVKNSSEDLANLQGKVFTTGVADIKEDAENIMTLKCQSCGAEVVIDTSNSAQARCHWCRNILSINEKVPNGSIPDLVLPFGITKEVAQKEIEKFVKKRQFYAHPKFRKEFTTENIMGVYLPYILVDFNSHVILTGQGEHTARRYMVKQNDIETTYYDADLYNVKREFDLVINGLTIESSKDKLNVNNANKTTNIINSIMPFDLDNCVKFNANYLKGYTSEKRDTNLEDLRPTVEMQAKDIAKFSVNNTLQNYDRGVAWQDNQMTTKGEKWQSAYLPVWLYSYLQVKGNQKILHYVAVNARTKETMGSVPIHYPKLFIISFLIEVLAVILMLFMDFDYDFLVLIAGFLYFFIMVARYRNKDARHYYETETNTVVSNLVSTDNFVMQRKGLTNMKMHGANNKTVSQSSNIGNVESLANEINKFLNK